MATFTVSVQESGGDYATLAAAIAGEAATGTGADILRIEIEGEWTNPDTAACNITGLAVGEVEIEAIGAARHPGVWSDTAYRLAPANNTPPFIRATPGRAIGIQVQYTGNTGSSRRVCEATFGSTSAIPFVFDSCIVRSVLSGTPGAVIGFGMNGALGDTDVVWANCIAYDCTTGQGFASLTTQGNGHVLNCTEVNSGTGVGDVNDDFRVINTLSVDNLTADYGAGSLTGSNNLSSDATAPGTSPITGAAVLFEDEGADDYRLSASDTSGAIDGGTDLSADAVYPFDHDITGATRTGDWDIGAHQVVAGGTIENVAGDSPGTSDDSLAAPSLTASVTATGSGTSADSAAASTIFAIAGTATDGGTPEEGATIYLIDQATDAVIDTTTTDASGEYRFEDVAAGTYHLVCEVDGKEAPSRSFVVVG
jgi:hypothetical protein